MFNSWYEIRHEFDVIGSSRNNLSIAHRRHLTINVFLTNGENITLKVLPTDTPRDVKRYIELEKDTILANQKLMHRQIELPDDKPLLEANIINGAIMRMVEEPARGNA